MQITVVAAIPASRLPMFVLSNKSFRRYLILAIVQYEKHQSSSYVCMYTKMRRMVYFLQPLSFFLIARSKCAEQIV